jgi:tetraacyldisaccharide 4'-kinase
MRSRPPVALEAVLWPAALAYRLVMSARNLLFDRSLRSRYSLAVPVVSIGNLTAGGTGKTPLTALLLKELSARGHRLSVVSRGYGGTHRGPARVPTMGGSAREFGDEPYWLATRFPEIPVVICRDRVEAVRVLVNGGEVQDLVFADDAFQHRRLRREFDIVVLDASEPEWHYRPLPVGRMREPFSALRRAHAVVITKCNLVEKPVRDKLRARILNWVPPSMVFELEAVLTGYSSLAGDTSLRAQGLDGKKVLLVSGIGRPEGFERLLANHVDIAGHEIFRDHHPYTRDDFARIEEHALRLGVETIIVTEKDAVKMQAWRPRNLNIWSSRMEFVGKLEGLYEALARLVSENN